MVDALRQWGNKWQREVFRKNIEGYFFPGHMGRQKILYDIQNYAKINFVPFVCILSNFQQMLKKMPKFGFFQFGPMVL